MLKKFGLGLAVVGALMFGVCTVNTVFVGSVMASHEEGNKVEIAQVPAVVKAAIEKETAGGAAKEIMKKEAEGKVFYAVKYAKNGMEKTLLIMYKVFDGGIYVEYIKDGMEKTVGFTEAGSAVAGKGKKGEIAHDNAGRDLAKIGSQDEGKKGEIAQVPAVVKAAIEKETAGCTVKGIVKHEADGKVCYAVEYVKDGMEKTAEFTEEGKRR